MADPKKHHFSPVFYLKGWCDTNSKIIEYSRPYKGTVGKCVSPDYTGFKELLYTLDGVPEEQKQDIEKKYMSLVDGRGATALNVLIQRDADKLTDNVRADWTRFLLACQYRGPDKIASMEEAFAERLKEDLNADPKNYATIKGSEVATPYEWIEKHASHLVHDAARHAAVGSIESQKAADIMINMEWYTFDLGNSKHELLTSDAPFLRTTGLAKSNCLIALPLNPQFLFIATHAKNTEDALRSKSATDIVAWVNDNIVRAASKYVYGRTISHLRFIENRLCLPGTLGPIVPLY
jgi:hypothetical protein